MKFWKTVPRVESGGQGEGLGWASVVEARRRTWRSRSSIVGLG